MAAPKHSANQVTQLAAKMMRRLLHACLLPLPTAFLGACLLLTPACQSGGNKGDGSEITGSRSRSSDDVLRRFTGDYQIVQDDEGNFMVKTSERTPFDGKEFNTSRGNFSGDNKTFRAQGYRGTRDFHSGGSQEHPTGTFRTRNSHLDGATASSLDRPYRSSTGDQSHFQDSTHHTSTHRDSERPAVGASGDYRVRDSVPGVSDREYRRDDVSRVSDWRPGHATHDIPTLRTLLGKDKEE